MKRNFFYISLAIFISLFEYFLYEIIQQNDNSLEIICQYFFYDLLIFLSIFKARHFKTKKKTFYNKNK